MLQFDQLKQAIEEFFNMKIVDWDEHRDVTPIYNNDGSIEKLVPGDEEIITIRLKKETV